MYVGTPVEGPGLEDTTHNNGVSVIPAKENASSIKANPPPLDPTMDRAPVYAAPIAMLMTAISFSGWTTVTPSFSLLEAR